MSAEGVKRPDRQPDASTVKQPYEAAEGVKRPYREPDASTVKQDG